MKLPDYDRPTCEQPTAVFLCHQQDGRACAGWVSVHDMDEMLGVRFAVALGQLAPETLEELRDYTTDVPLFDSGAEAFAHGMKDVARPSEKAVRMISRLERKIAP